MGWNAARIAVGADNNARLLWTKNDETTALWVTNTGGNLLVNYTYGAYAYWAASALAAGADNRMRALWNKTDGTTAYVRLLREFVFLAVLLDVYSRRSIGWAMAHHLRAELPLAALQMALRQRLARSEPHRLVHHSDRGTQYASDLYTGLLTEYGIRIGMSRAGNPYDDAFAEGFIKTPRYEEVNLTTTR